MIRLLRRFFEKEVLLEIKNTFEKWDRERLNDSSHNSKSSIRAVEDYVLLYKWAMARLNGRGER